MKSLLVIVLVQSLNLVVFMWFNRVGRIRVVAMGPDGHLYIASSNRDGRGKPQVGDDRIYRVVP